MSSNFWHSSHARYHLHPRSRLSTARATDLRYCTPRQHYCLGIWFANLIQKLGKRLLLRQIPIATATVFFRRFYLKNSICETNPYLVLAACVFVAAKVEETPVHIKSVVTEAKLVFAENHIKIFPAESHKLGEMEFYLLEDLDFHLIVFHPYRALLHMCGREPADGGKFPRSRLEEDGEVKRREGERGRKREEVRKAEMGRPPAAGSGLGSGAVGGVGVGVGVGVGAGSSGHAGSGAKGIAAEDDEEESEEKRIRRLMGRGTGEGLMEIEESVLQICLFLLNDTYRTDVHLLYPPYVIALSALYIGFCLTALNNATSTRTRSSSSQLQTLASSIEVNAALGLPPPPKDAAEFIASFEVAMPVLLACVQDIVVLYPIWEAFEPTQRAGGVGAGAGAGGMSAGGGVAGGIGGAGMGAGLGAGMAGNTGMGMATLAAAAAAASGQNGVGAGAVGGKKDAEGKEKFGPEEAEALVRRMIEERMVDVGHPDNAGAGVTGTANGGAATATATATGHGNGTGGIGGSGIAQVAGKKRKA